MLHFCSVSLMQLPAVGWTYSSYPYGKQSHFFLWDCSKFLKMSSSPRWETWTVFGSICTEKPWGEPWVLHQRSEGPQGLARHTKPPRNKSTDSRCFTYSPRHRNGWLKLQLNSILSYVDSHTHPYTSLCCCLSDDSSFCRLKNAQTLVRSYCFTHWWV